MKRRVLGSTGIRVSEIGFGTWAIGGDAYGSVAYGAADDEASLSALADAQAMGCTFFDTSNLYGWGHAEDLLGQAFAGCRSEVVIATKAGYTTPDGRQDFSLLSIRASLDGSLRRLRTEYVDLLQLHNPPPESLEDRDDLFEGLARLVDEGLVRAIGISARSPDEALLFVRRHQPSFVQVSFNLGDLRAWRNGLFKTCRDRDIGLVIRTPLAAGFLTGTIGPAAEFAPSDHRRRFAPDIKARWAEAVRLLAPVFEDAPGATPAQNAIRFCLSFDAVSTVIPGMTRSEDVREDLGTAPLPRLQSAQVQAVEAIYDRLFG